jgi:hypothetical protein
VESGFCDISWFKARGQSPIFFTTTNLRVGFSRFAMKQKSFVSGFSILLLAVTCLAVGLVVSPFVNPSVRAEDKSADTLTIKGTCEFMNRPGTWSAVLTPTDTPDVYDAQYVASFSMGGPGGIGGDHMTYVGQIKSDFKTTISGNGESTGGGGNGNFEFSGTYGDDGIAQCNYKEIGGQRSGALTAEKPE